MRRTLLLSLLVVGATVALAVGAVSVMADKGGPEHGVEHGVATGLQDDGDGVVTQQNGEGEPEMVGAKRIAETLAEQFDGVDAETVLTLHADDNGFGKLYKAYLIAEASDGTMTVDDVLAAAETDGFGVLFKDMADQVSVLTEGEDGLPKNLGQAISGTKKADTASAVAAVNGGEDDGGQGPPDHAPAHGRR